MNRAARRAKRAHALIGIAGSIKFGDRTAQALTPCIHGNWMQMQGVAWRGVGTCNTEYSRINAPWPR